MKTVGEKLRQAMAVDEEGDVCFPLSGGRCPFLDGENLCEIHRELGEEATSVPCQEHPRFTEDYGSFREISLSASCPAANALVLSNAKLEPNSVYAGVPAKKVKEVTPEQREEIIRRTAHDYMLYASWFKEDE